MILAAGNSSLRVIGQPLPKVDAAAKVSGQTIFADDIALPRMLHAKLVRGSHPHAWIENIDTTMALALPGVLAVITGEDLPIRYGILPVTQDEQALASDKVRYVGDPVAAVAAVDEETAAAAAELVCVEYRLVEPIMTMDQALDIHLERIHSYGGPANLHKLVALEFGDVDKALADADLVREDLFFYQGNTHLPLEQHSCIASWGADQRLTVWSTTQTPHYLHRALGKVLGLPMSQIRVIATPEGGGFGGKSDPFNHELAVAKLSMVTGRPVKITLTREEVFYAHRGRHPVLIWVRTGVTSDGLITGMDFRTLLDGGAFGSYGVATTFYTGALQTTTYRIPNYRFHGCRVFTNKPPCGPKRGHGTPQPRFALELHLDHIADQLAISPVELRRRNLTPAFSRTCNWLRITSSGLVQCIDRVLEASGFNSRPRLGGRGMGFACSSYLSGAGSAIYWNDMPHSECQIKVDRGGVTVYCGAIDIGQGSDSVLAYVVAEELGIRPEQVRLITADTDLTPVDLGSYSSRVTFMAGNAALEAARRMRGMILAAVAQKFELPIDAVNVGDGMVRLVTGQTIEFADAAQIAEAHHGTLVSTGSYTPPVLAGPYKGSGVGPSPAYSFSACVVDLSCDQHTGEITVHKVWVAHDCGRAINPLLVEGQVEGGVYMGLGEALMEEQVFRHGLHKGPSMLDYKSPTCLDVPEIETILVESDDPEGPYGAKEAGQGPLLPVPPAVASALHDALGIWIHEVPITPDKVLTALAAMSKGESPVVAPRGFPSVPWPEPIRVPRPTDQELSRADPGQPC